MNSATAHDNNCDDSLYARENEAWSMVIERETGRGFRTEREIQQTTDAEPRRIQQMVGRCRIMRKVLGWDAKLPADWWVARVMVLPDATRTTSTAA